MLPEDVLRPTVPVVGVEMLKQNERVCAVSTPSQPVHQSLDLPLVFRVINLRTVEPAASQR